MKGGTLMSFFTAEQEKEIETIVDDMRSRYKWIVPIMAGNPTATEYDSLIANFSTVTEIHQLKDGLKVFVIHQYRFAWIHRLLDALMKWLTNCFMRKARFKDWAETFCAKTFIPDLWTNNYDTVVLRYIPNINMYDLIANGDVIEDFGACAWAQDFDSKMACQLIEKLVDDLSQIHDSVVGAWGEIILQNCIVDQDKSVHICDPEMQFYKGLDPNVAQARDLYDLICNVSAVMEKRFGTDPAETIALILYQYKNPSKKDVFSALLKICERKLSFFEKIFFPYTKERLGLESPEQYFQIRLQLKEFLKTMN